MRKEEGTKEVSRCGGGNGMHHRPSHWAASDVGSQPILSPQPSPVIGSRNTHLENSPEWVQCDPV